MKNIIIIFVFAIFLSSCSHNTSKLPQAGQETKLKINSEDNFNNLFIFYPKLKDLVKFEIVIDILKGKEWLNLHFLSQNEYVIEINSVPKNRIKPGTWAKINLSEGNQDLNFFFYDSPIEFGPGPKLSFRMYNKENKYIILVADCDRFYRKSYEACDANIEITNKEDWTKKVNKYFDKLKSE